jgi:hypothetical protein
VTDAEYGHLAPWANDGIFQSNTDVVYANSSGREVHVRTGKTAIVQGHAWQSGTSEINLTIGANTSGSTRVDTVVLRLDRSTWDVTVEVRAGTPGAGAPTLQRDTGDTGLWEIPVANVTVDNGAAAIASNKVTARPLLQSGATRPCNIITDIQATLAVGDTVYEASTGRWIGWTAAGGVVLYQDTGWVTANANGFWANGGFTPKIRRQGALVYLKGSVDRTSSALPASDTDSGCLHVPATPTGFAPAESHNWTGWSNPAGALRLWLDTGGQVHVTQHSAPIPIGGSVYLDTVYMAG